MSNLLFTNFLITFILLCIDVPEGLCTCDVFLSWPGVIDAALLFVFLHNETSQTEKAHWVKHCCN